MTDFTTTPGATVARPTRIQPGRCEECCGPICGGRKRKYCRPKCRNFAKLRFARDRQARRTPEEKAARCAQKLAWGQSLAGLRSYYKTKRKGRLNGTQGYRTREDYLKGMARANRRRRKKHRDWARKNQTRYVGKRLKPTCVTCGAEVPWNGRYRPRHHCPVHDTARRRCDGEAA